MMLEATCTACGETFNPHDETDTMHAIREDGAWCGGPGVIVGAWCNTAPAGIREERGGEW